MSKATESALGALHFELAEALRKRIESGDATAAEMAVAAKFLKDNAISVDPENNAALDDFAAALRNKGRVPSKRERDAAMKEISGGLLQ